MFSHVTLTARPVMPKSPSVRSLQKQASGIAAVIKSTAALATAVGKSGKRCDKTKVAKAMQKHIATASKGVMGAAQSLVNVAKSKRHRKCAAALGRRASAIVGSKAVTVTASPAVKSIARAASAQSVKINRVARTSTKK
jgi:hypothetical protein